MTYKNMILNFIRNSDEMEFFLEKVNNNYVIKGIQADTLIYKQGFRNGDIIIKIDQHQTAILNLQNIILLILKNQTMLLTIKRFKSSFCTIERRLSAKYKKHETMKNNSENNISQNDLKEKQLFTKSDSIENIKLKSRHSDKVYQYNKEPTTNKIINESGSLITKANSLKSPKDDNKLSPITTNFGADQQLSPFKRWFYRSSSNINKPDNMKTYSVNTMKEKIDWNVSKFSEIKDLQQKNLLDTSIKNINAKDRQKLHLSLEYIKREVTFVTNLSYIGKYFYDPFIHESIFPKNDVDKIFSHFPPFFEFFKNYVSELCEICKNKTFLHDFFSILYENFVGSQKDQYAHLWIKFIQQNSIGRNYLKNLISNNPKLKNFMTNSESHPDLKKLGLFDIFQTIHKHVAEYPMFFQRFLEYTPANNENRNQICEIIESSKNLLKDINQTLKMVQDDEIHSIYNQKIEKCLKSEKYINLLPDMDFSAEKVKGHYTVIYKTKRKTCDYIMLVTTRYIFLFQRKNSKIKFKPIEVQDIDSPKKFFVLVILIKNIKKVYESSVDSADVIIEVLNYDKKYSFKICLTMDSRDQRKEFINVTKNSINELQLLTNYPSELSEKNKLHPLSDRSILRPFKNRELDLIESKMINMAKSYVKTISFLKKKHENLNLSEQQMIIEAFSRYIVGYQEENREEMESCLPTLLRCLSDSTKPKMKITIDRGCESDLEIFQSPFIDENNNIRYSPNFHSHEWAI